MSSAELRPERSPPVLARHSDQPNLPEVSGTSFPVVTTVLAGFDVTIAVQLIIRPDASDELTTKAVASIVVLLASTLLFISSIVFAVNAQANNYLPFLDLSMNSRQQMGIDDFNDWLDNLQRGWNLFHWASIVTFYGGILLLLAGVNLIVWEFVGDGVALAFLFFIMLNLALTLGVGLWFERTKRYGKSGSQQSTPVSPSAETREELERATY